MKKFEIIPVQFMKVGKIYYFEKSRIEVKNQDFVVVETARGLEIGIVAGHNKFITEEEINNDLKPILRKATQNDLKKYENNKIIAKDAFDKCLIEINRHQVEMKLLNAEYTLDRKKIVFSYIAEGRVDFRELVKSLAQKFKIRVELRQVGERDGAKHLGGIGICGRELCCSKHLCNFDSVSIKMAKNQDLALNPTKITGCCGKLMCCIRYENDLYTDLKKDMPKVNSFVKPKCLDCQCKVLEVDIFKRDIVIEHEDSRVKINLEDIDGRDN